MGDTNRLTKMKTKNIFLIIVPLLLIALSMNTYAFGVTAFYWDKKPLYLNPGESREIQAFGLQNMVGEKDITISVEQVSGLEVAEIIDESLSYKVPYGSKDVYINMKVTIPSDAKIGQVYSIGLRFKESAGEKSGESIQTVGGMTNSIEIVVGKRIEESKKAVEENIPIQTPKEEQPIETIITETLKKGYSKTPLIILFILVISIIIFFRYESRKKNI